MFTTQMTVGELVVGRPSRSRAFERMGIDYCCGGRVTLEAACAKKGLDPEMVAQMLDAEDLEMEPAVDAAALSMSELADHIEQTHHRMLRTELPRLRALAEKVARAHGNADPRLVELLSVVDGFRLELQSHMMKEEQILFPMIRDLDGASGSDGVPQFHCGSIANPIGVMEHEHDHAGDALKKMRELTDGYTPPASACNTYLALLDGLSALEADMHQHVHKENNILFPRARAKESLLRQMR